MRKYIANMLFRQKIARRWRVMPVCLAIALLWPIHCFAELKLKISGVGNGVADNIRLHLSSWESLPGNDIDAVDEALRPTVEEALRALGYYQFTIKFSFNQPQEAEQIEKPAVNRANTQAKKTQSAPEVNDRTLYIDIVPGSPITWGKVEIQVNGAGGVLNSEVNTVIDNHPFVKDAVINHQLYENYKNNLFSTVRSQGFLDAKWQKSQLEINTVSGKARVTLILDAQQRYQIDSVEYLGSNLSRDLIDNIAKVPIGDWYHADIVGQVYNRLLSSSYFESVFIDTERQDTKKIRLVISLQDLPKHRVSTGIGYGTDTGPRGKISWTRPRLNRRGDSFTTEIKVSNLEQDALFRYRVPWDHPINRYLSWDTGWQRESTDDKEIKTIKTGLAFHHLRDNGWQLGHYVNLEHEISQQGSDPEQSDTYVIPGISVSKRQFSGDANDPRQGYKFWANFSASRQSLGSDVNFERLQTGVNYLFSVAQKHSLLTRIELGHVRTNDIGQVPLSQRFYTGGDQSVRGYKFESIAPLDADGDLTGGQSVNVGSVEYRYQWQSNWKFAVFADTGRAYNEDSERFRHSAGFGVRWKSPVGLISFDIAAPINETDENLDSVRFHIYMGSPL